MKQVTYDFLLAPTLSHHSSVTQVPCVQSIKLFSSDTKTHHMFSDISFQ